MTAEFFEENNYLFIGEQNDKIKEIKGIISNTKPNPKKHIIAEGIWAAKKVLEFGVKILSLVFCPEFIVTEENESLVRKLTPLCDYRNRFAVSARVFQKISERDKPDGLLIIAALPMHDLSKLKLTDKSTILVLDGIEIPGNVGTMLRTADGAGIDAVFLVNKKARLTHPKCIKGSMGAILSKPIFDFSDIKECQSYLTDNNFTIYLADTRAEKYYFDEPFGKKTALVMGSERYGISKSWYDLKHTMISIPMLGSCDSLNVGVAATVLCYEAASKNRFKRNAE